MKKAYAVHYYICHFDNYLVSMHGHCDRVLINVSRRLGAFGWSGSLIPYCEEKISIYKSFENHKLSKVRDWAHTRIAKLIKDIDRGKQHEEEDLL